MSMQSSVQNGSSTGIRAEGEEAEGLRAALLVQRQRAALPA